MKTFTILVAAVMVMFGTAAASPSAEPLDLSARDLAEESYFNPLLKRQCCGVVRCRRGGCPVSYCLSLLYLLFIDPTLLLSAWLAPCTSPKRISSATSGGV